MRLFIFRISLDYLPHNMETWVEFLQVVVAVMEELVARGGLVSAISNRDAPSLEPLLAFLCK